jgi:hypothetical protein
VSTDHAGTVCVWDIPTGRLRLSFCNTHDGASISAAAFDSNQRRLITGQERGLLPARVLAGVMNAAWNSDMDTVCSSTHLHVLCKMCMDFLPLQVKKQGVTHWLG